MIPLIYDCEATGAQRNKANPFDPRNKLCCISYHLAGNRGVFKIAYDDDPYKHKLDNFQELIDEADLVVGFNLKFDIHWGRRYGLRFDDSRIWDCQLYHFLQSNQRAKFPSLDEVAARWDVPLKLNIVKTEYWDKGLDTDQVPWDILEEYAGWDVDPVTLQVFNRQYSEFKQLPEARRRLSCFR
jgi:DNA polymerase I-like protein with 3'-5' exonuclease and polymerase domains